MSTLANLWADRGDAVTLVTLAPRTNDFYPLHPGVERVGLNQSQMSARALERVVNNVKRVSALRKTIRLTRPEVVISFVDTTNVLVLLASRGLRVPVVISERTDPRRHEIGRAWALGRRISYPIASAVVVQSPETARWAGTIVPPRRVYTIPNPLAPEFTRSVGKPTRTSTSRPLDSPRVLAMGRLSWEKGFDLLLRAFRRVHLELPGASLRILGEGPERGALERLAHELGIAEHLHLPGAVSDPHRWLCDGELFVLPSRYEGYPNALAEAMACGLAVVATDCPYGPRQLIRSGENGVLVTPGDPDALGNAMLTLLRSPSERARLAERAVEVRHALDAERILEEWNAVISTLCEARSAPDPTHTAKAR
jgi:GalNAc-alpha-(1->4)-GalNAc-alpha-(1->3)-diNAcBac-PP-undecaprenol alpha-1,4-N-acetyl-D-galactosaminyltransferase